MKQLTTILTTIVLFAQFSEATALTPLYESFDITPDSVFMDLAEGPAVSPNGTLYAVNYRHQGTIGFVKPDGSHGLFVDLPEGSTGNGIRLWKNETLLVADYTGHNILQIDINTKSISVLAHNPQMSQPNDIAISSKGVVYASDPDWENNSGRIWMTDQSGKLKLLMQNMGTVNGIELSPDEKLLYVNESNQRNIWVFDIQDDGTLANKRLLIKFADYGFDGMRCDEKGNLYVARFNKGTVAIISPDGKLIREVVLKGDQPTNVAFGGKDGKTVYVTVADRGAIEAFRTEFRGRALLLQDVWHNHKK
ncbi:SMP-30/gluconolactonase/LRE family protein [Thermophagus xiamenensis]|uniref:Sugar lactone lactonase YvrE n=1 Tax=Thermophagus xiamenensis TaxID=385682 RepID=A0A1I2BUH1_9BACT|nr:SMP-30/gluconolactonase/LRE family protein [Thermophagus xiamenensis]SFE59697.1 Sugar lactone lactonase YvrE [Thermophagus xiamenensis]